EKCACTGRVVLDEGLLDADCQRDVVQPRNDVLPRALKSHGSAGATALDIGDAYALREKSVTHQRREADLAANVSLAERTHAAIAEPRTLDLMAVFETGFAEHSQIGLARQILETAIRKLSE